jgi:hypothetical protein
MENNEQDTTTTPEVEVKNAQEGVLADGTPVVPAAEVTTAQALPHEEVVTDAPAAPVDYSQYAAMAETPSQTERRTFDYIAVSGAVQTEVMDDGETEKRLPATATKLLLTKPTKADGKLESETLQLPLTLVPIKYRVVMEQRAGNTGEILVLRSSEFNGKMSDLVTISRYSQDGKVIEKYGPMTVSEARQTFKNAEGKGVLRDKAHVYALHNGEVVRFVVKGAGLWEDRKGLVNGKTENSRKEYPFLTEYLSTFAMTDPYFLYEMKVDAAYRDHGAVKFYRPIFEKGARINLEVETTVLTSLQDLHKYFTEQDAETAKFVATVAAPTGPVEDDELDEHGNPKAF